MGMTALAGIIGADPAAGAWGYHLHDHLGSARRIHNQAKDRIARFDFTPYGEIFHAENPGAAAPRFTGKALDAESGLYHFPYRYYNPQNARWLTRDPLGMVDGPNVYAYVRSRPIASMDHLGLWTVEDPDAWLHPTPPPPIDLQGCENAAPKTADSGVCTIYGPRDSYLFYGARCVCENAGDSDWDKTVRGCLACAKRKNIPSGPAHRACYKVADQKHGILAGIKSQLDIGVRLSHVCLCNSY